MRVSGLEKMFDNKALLTVLVFKAEERLANLLYLPVCKSIPCISRPSIFDGQKKQFLNFFVNCSLDTNLVFFNFWNSGYTRKSGPQVLNSFVVR